MYSYTAIYTLEFIGLGLSCFALGLSVANLLRHIHICVGECEDEEEELIEIEESE